MSAHARRVGDKVMRVARNENVRGMSNNELTRGGKSFINATALLAPINASVFSASRELVSYKRVWVAAIT